MQGKRRRCIRAVVLEYDQGGVVLKTKSASQCDGKRIGAPMDSRYRSAAGVTDKSTAAWNTCLQGPRRFGRLRTDAAMGNPRALANLRRRAQRWHQQGWKLKTIAKHLGTSARVVAALLEPSAAH